MKTENYKNNEKNCSGLNKDLKPCPYIDECDLCIWYSSTESEDYFIGLGQNAFKCKRDNPDYKPMTKKQFIEIYKKMPNKTNISLGELLECARIDGMVEE